LRSATLMLAAVACAVTGCNSLPKAGPDTKDIIRTSSISASAASRSTSSASYNVIPVTAEIADVASSGVHNGFAGSFSKSRYVPNIKIGVGDTVSVTIFEAASGGLFSGDPGTENTAKNVTMPNQTVERDGYITVPYAGRIKVDGRTTAEVQAEIETALTGKAIQPQAIVSVISPTSSSVTVTGDVVTSKRVPLSLKGDRILDAIAAAGGPRFPAYETFVSLTRGKTTATVLLAKLIADPSQNIYLRPDDSVFLFKQPQTFTAFGATTSNAVVPFNAVDLNLAEAVGRAGGLLDLRADPSGVFVFRYENPDVARRLGIAAPPDGRLVPVVYRANLKDPNSYFASQRFLVRDKDVLYVSNAPSTDLQKFLTLIGSGVLVARNTAQTATSIHDITQ